MTPKRIPTLLATADQEWSLLLSGSLRQKGFAPLSVAESGERATLLYYRVKPHLVLLDLELPSCNTTKLCTEMLHTQPDVKIVLMANEEEHLALAALHTGVVGCIDRNFPVTKWPGVLDYVLDGGAVFSRVTLEVLLTQTRTVQNREPSLSIGPLLIDLTRHLVLYAGRPVPLTPREFDLLACLARNVDHVVSVDQLLNEAWRYDTNDGTSAQVRVCITRLRRKLTEDAHLPDFILNERGVGYRLHSGMLRRTVLQPSNGNSYNPLRTVVWLPGSFFAPQRATAAGATGKSISVAEQIKTARNGLVDDAPRHSLVEQSDLVLEHSQWMEPLWLHLLERLHPTQEFGLHLLTDLLPRVLPVLW